MKTLSLLSFGLAVQYVAGFSEHFTPFGLKIFDSHIPRQLAEELISSTKNESDKSYERLYIGDPDTQKGNDEYICEIHPESTIESSKKREKVAEPEKESQADILAKAMGIVHETFPPEFCLWAYDLRGLYWTYAFCSADKIIQYHEGASPEERTAKHIPQQPSTVFVLGRFSKASANELSFKNQASESQYKAYVKEAERTVTLLDEKSVPFTHHSAQKAVSQIVTDGTTCDMTLQPRTVEVVYKCDGHGSTSPAIIDVLEIKTCHYKMFVHVPGLCQYSPFSPMKNTQDSVVDIRCQRVQSPSESHISTMKTFDEFTKNTVLRDHPQFPVRPDNRIDISDHYLVALGRGFYFARSKREFETPSTYFKTRNVVLFNGFHTDLTDLNAQFAKVIFKSVGSSLLAPGPQELPPQMLQWSHSFLMWFEMYDYMGNLLGVTRIEHDASAGKNVLKAQLLDPVTLLDSEGDIPQLVTFERPDYEAPYEMWNFEEFSEKGEPLKGGKPKKPEQTTENPKKFPLENGDLRPIMAHNRGLLENSRVKMELVDQTTGELLDGHYDDDHYIFEIKNKEGHAQVFAVKAMNPDQDFMGFTVILGSTSTNKEEEYTGEKDSEQKKYSDGEPENESLSKSHGVDSDANEARPEPQHGERDTFVNAEIEELYEEARRLYQETSDDEFSNDYFDEKEIEHLIDEL